MISYPVSGSNRYAELLDIVREAVKVVTIEGEHFAMYANPQPAAQAIAAFMAEASQAKIG